MRNDDKEQHGLEILNLDNLEKFVSKCIVLPQDFKKQWVKDDVNGLMILIFKVCDRIPELEKWENDTKRDTTIETLQVAFARFLGFDDDEHLCEWLGENPQWAPEHWCGGSTDIFNDSEIQGFVVGGVHTYDQLINELCALYDTYNFTVYNNA